MSLIEKLKGLQQTPLAENNKQMLHPLRMF